MINEVVEVREYLSGENINKKNLYRICFLLSKWFKEQGLPHVEIRKSIFDWAKTNHIYIKYNLNNIIYRALEDKSRLKDNITVKINGNDIEEIKSRFDSRNARLLALAILCYAKAYADGNKTFGVSSVALSAWLKINDGNLRHRHMRELLDFDYISKVSLPKNNYKWEENTVYSQYRINVDLHNSGSYVLIDNNILDLYSDIFC